MRRAAVLGLLAAALAQLAPLHLAQTMDAILLDTLTHIVPADATDTVVILDVEQAAAAAAIAAGSPVTIIGPRSIAVGPVASSPWTEAAAWLASLITAAALLGTRRSLRRHAILLGIAGPCALLALSGTAFSAASAWIPVAAPSIFLLVAGTATLAALRPARAELAEPVAPEAARHLLEHGDLLEAWKAYRDLAPMPSRLAELYELGTRLAGAGYPELAADSFLRVALVDSSYRDVAARLVGAGHADDPSFHETRQHMRAGMPATLGRYQLLEPIGKGTSGRVYLARDPSINRLLAIKLIDLDLGRDPDAPRDAIERFQREAETTGRLSHPNIVTIHDMGESGGLAYIAMEYVKGERLSRYTTVERLLPAELVLELGALTADALDYAHGQNVIHRDIKPANIMYDSVTGDLKITDFGIARLIDVNRTRTGIVLGTPSFMAPEQIEGGNVKGHTDLFALGVTLYELLTGQLPFRGNSMTKLMFVIANEPHLPASAVRPDLPKALDAVIDTALDKNPAARFQRGAEMADALRDVAAQLA